MQFYYDWIVCDRAPNDESVGKGITEEIHNSKSLSKKKKKKKKKLDLRHSILQRKPDLVE